MNWELLSVAVVILVAGLVGWYTRGQNNRGEFSTYVDRASPELRAFEKRNQKLLG